MILQELNRYYERLLADPERDVPARHWSVEKAAWELKLSCDGRLLGAYQLTAGTGKELRRFVSLRVPEHTTRCGTGMLPFFLCDNAAYLLGYDEKRGPEKLASAHALHEAVLGECDDEGAQAVLRFFEREDRDADLDEGVRSRVTVTGNPVRKSVFDATREDGRARFGVPEDARLLLVTGGSLGARHLNQAVCALKDELLAAGDVHVIHVTGPKELDAVAGQLALTPAEEKRWHLFGYTDRMGDAMAAADAIVSRAGATSLAEISARAIPALLVPFPFATEDHQTTNARAYVEAGCAYMLADADVEGPEFARLVRSLLDDAGVRERMAAAARAQKTADAAAKLADVVMGAAR